MGSPLILALKPNYAFKRTADLALRSNQFIAPLPLNAALGLSVSASVLERFKVESAISLVQGWLNDNARIYKTTVLKEIEIDVERRTLSACYTYGGRIIDVVAWDHNKSLDVLVMRAVDGKIEEALVGSCLGDEELIDRLKEGFRSAVHGI